VSTSATSLNYGSEYSFSAWSWNQTESLWSNSYSTDSATTNPNQSPMFGSPSPGNGSSGNAVSFSWSIPINDPEGNNFSWTIQCNNSQTNSGTAAGNGTKTLMLSDSIFRG
jgi:hypothetical protein